MCKTKEEHLLEEINIQLKDILKNTKNGPTFIVLADLGKKTAILASISRKELYNLMYNFCIQYPKYISSIGAAAMRAGIEKIS